MLQNEIIYDFTETFTNLKYDYKNGIPATLNQIQNPLKFWFDDKLLFLLDPLQN